MINRSSIPHHVMSTMFSLVKENSGYFVSLIEHPWHRLIAINVSHWGIGRPREIKSIEVQLPGVVFLLLFLEYIPLLMIIPVKYGINKSFAVL